MFPLQVLSLVSFVLLVPCWEWRVCDHWSGSKCAVLASKSSKCVHVPLAPWAHGPASMCVCVCVCAPVPGAEPVCAARSLREPQFPMLSELWHS